MTRTTLMALAAAALLSACAQTTGGSSQRADAMAQLRSDATPHDQAHAYCWERAWGRPHGGQGVEASMHADYTACMGQAGWRDKRPVF